MSGVLTVRADADALTRYAAEWLLQRALATPGRFIWCLSGGSTPKALYSLLATAEFSERFPWDRTHLFFGDERFVPPEHPDSNYRMARQAMIDHVPIPAAQVHPWQTTGDDPEHAALHYADTLKRIYDSDTLDPARPLFDAMLLGLGEDGHTASLFPGVAALSEQTAWTAAIIGAKPEPRLTMTYPVLNSSKAAVFLVAGAGKRDILRRVFAGDATLPAAGVHPAGELHWFADEAAARQ